MRCLVIYWLFYFIFKFFNFMYYFLWFRFVLLVIELF